MLLGLVVSGTGCSYALDFSGLSEDGPVDAGVVDADQHDAADQPGVGGFQSCAAAEGRLRCWGRNDTGAVGDGTREDRFIPTMVIGL